jgi:hypothetical protein
MNSLTKLIASSVVVSASSTYETNYEVSRNGKDVKYVFQISAQGSHTPKVNLNLAKNAEEEPK